MHDNETMVLMPGTRMPSLHHGHHVTDLTYSLLGKKSFDVLGKTPDLDDFDDSYDEDDDDFSDHDSHYSEDEIDSMPLPTCHVMRVPEPPTEDVPQRLLGFIDIANSDIQKFFGRRKGEEDSCDIYEDKWTSGKSGRELYYADLLKIAQGGDTDRPLKSSKSSAALAKIEETTDNRHDFSGKMNEKLGLGPLSDLFEYGLKNFLSESNIKHGPKKAKRLKVDHSNHHDLVPMLERKFPESFWKEPGARFNPRMNDHTSVIPGTVPQSPKPPDFSDLLHQWTGVGPIIPDDFSADLSSSEMSMTSQQSS